jgi:hypothetical protein
MGLLGNGFDDPRSAAVMALAGGLLQGNFGGGLLGANSAYAEQKNAAAKQQFMQMQMDAMRQEQEQKRAAIEQAQRKQQALPGLFNGGMSAGAFAPSADGMGPTMPQSAAPPAGFDVQRALAAGYGPDEIAKLHGLTNLGRQKVARTVKGMGPDGKEYEYQVDEFGQRVGDGMAQYRAPLSIRQGDRETFADPYSLKPMASFGINQSPDSKASNALGWANHGLSKQRLDHDRSTQASQPRGQFLETPNGYVLANPKDGSVMPVVGPDGQPLKGKAADRQMTDAQAKANLFGSRMAESNRILSSLEGKYSPMAVNAKSAAAGTPGVGGVAGMVGNAMLSQESQMAEQAQRDFINAVLRRESGAVISAPEFENAKQQYFPQPLDKPANLAQKKRNRELAIAGMAAEVPGGLRNAPQAGAASGGWSIQKVN